MSEERILCILAETPAAEYAEEVGDGIIEPVLRTPWGAMKDMMFFARLDPVWEPLDEAKIKPEYHRRGGHLAFRAGDPPSIEAQLMNTTCVTAGLYVPEERFGPADRDHAREALHRMLAQLPSGAEGSIFVDALGERHLAARWFERHGIASLPEPLVGLPWLVALPLSNYGKALSIPGVAVEERDGRVWIQLYDDPFAYDTAAAVRRIAAISARLEHVGALWSPAED